MAHPADQASPRQVATDLRLWGGKFEGTHHPDLARALFRGANVLTATLEELDRARDRIVELEAMLDIERGS